MIFTVNGEKRDLEPPARGVGIGHEVDPKIPGVAGEDHGLVMSAAGLEDDAALQAICEAEEVVGIGTREAHSRSIKSFHPDQGIVSAWTRTCLSDSELISAGFVELNI